MVEKSKDNKNAPAIIGEGEIKARKNALDKMAARLDVSPATLKATLMATAFSLCKEDCKIADCYFGSALFFRNLTAYLSVESSSDHTG